MNTPVRIDYGTLTDLEPAERFAAAGGVQNQARASQARYRAMVVMELWEAALGPAAARLETVATTLDISPQRVRQLLATGQDWLWSTVLDPAVPVLMGADRRADLADTLADEGETWTPLAQRIRRTRSQTTPLTLRELDAVLPVVEDIPEVYAVRDRLVPTIRSARWDAAAEQWRRFTADLDAMANLAPSTEDWAALYGYQRAVTVLEQVLAHNPGNEVWLPYLGDGAADTSRARLRNLVRQASEAGLLAQADMTMDERRNREARVGTWRWGLANA